MKPEMHGEMYKDMMQNLLVKLRKMIGSDEKSEGEDEVKEVAGILKGSSGGDDAPEAADEKSVLEKDAPEEVEDEMSGPLELFPKRKKPSGNVSIMTLGLKMKPGKFKGKK